jgi:hypothetical protein
MHMKRLFLPLLLVLSLCSCIGIQSQLSLNRDGSGTLRLDYRISQFMREDRSLPLPLSREDFQRVVEAAPGLKLLSLSQREDENDIYISATLGFDKPDSLNALGDPQQIGLAYSERGGKHALQQLLYRGRQAEQLSADSLKMIDAFFQGYELSYQFSAPAPIQSASVGTLSQDRRSLSYKTTIPDLLKQEQKVLLEVTW